MSTYLLLRNNKESGPFTMDEIRRMSLKAYDLVWVEGKSAAWRYPGEIPEFTSFAPQIPEQPFDRFYKKTPSATSSAENKTKTTESSVGEEESYLSPAPNQSREGSREPLYINMPGSDKKAPLFTQGLNVQKSVELNWEEPARSSGNINKMPDKTKRTSGKGLLIASVILLFGAGMCTGFFISNRGNFYSTDTNPPHTKLLPVMSKDFPQSAPEQSALTTRNDTSRELGNNKPVLLSESTIRSGSKSKKKPAPLVKDTIHQAVVPVPVSNVTDSSRIKQEIENKKDALTAKIKAHPEDYLLITAGKYKVGVLGGISEFPLTLSNRSGVTIDQVVVAVDYILHNKKVFKTEDVSFQNLATGTTVTSEAPKSSRGIKISYRIKIANAQQIGLSYSN
ncbi:MAG: hypothetical protein Q8939_12650 [Bacteroidota bacterium]|nr:hypothetical protein [Bacteroidota bacterium]